MEKTRRLQKKTTQKKMNQAFVMSRVGTCAESFKSGIQDQLICDSMMTQEKLLGHDGSKKKRACYV